jgi:hypothetical protein
MTKTSTPQEFFWRKFFTLSEACQCRRRQMRNTPCFVTPADDHSHGAMRNPAKELWQRQQMREGSLVGLNWQA